eukprot:4155952-Amphidinium_carterae.1
MIQNPSQTTLLEDPYEGSRSLCPRHSVCFVSSQDGLLGSGGSGCRGLPVLRSSSFTSLLKLCARLLGHRARAATDH